MVLCGNANNKRMKIKILSVCSEETRKILRAKGRVEIPVFSRKFSSGRDHLAASTITEINFPSDLTKN